MVDRYFHHCKKLPTEIEVGEFFRPYKDGFRSHLGINTHLGGSEKYIGGMQNIVIYDITHCPYCGCDLEKEYSKYYKEKTTSKE